MSSIILSIILAISSIFIISLYDVVDGRILQDEDRILENMSYEARFLLLAKAKELDPEYTPFMFSEEVPVSIQEEAMRYLEEKMKRTVEILDEDINFAYCFTNTATSRMQSSTHFGSFNENDRLQSRMTYDENGDIMYHDGYEGYGAASTFSEEIFYDIFEISYASESDDSIDSEERIMVKIGNEEMDSSHIQFQSPRNLEIEYQIPRAVKGSTGRVAHYVSSLDNNHYFATMAMWVVSVGIGLYILLCPIRFTKERYPFTLVTKGYFEIVITIVWILLFLSCNLVLAVSNSSINGDMIAFLKRFSMVFNEGAVLGLNFIVWMVFFMLVAVTWFYVKYIGTYGWRRFMVEKMWIGKKMQGFFQIQLDKPMTAILAKYMGIHVLIILCILLLGKFGMMVAIIYGLALFAWLRPKVAKIQTDYKVLLRATEQLGEGNFDEDSMIQVGIFNGLRDAIRKIREGFKKAVKEETKSQHMKTELITNVSHDLKTPITCIKNYAELLQDETITPEDSVTYIQNINQYANRLSRLIEDLFDVSKANSGNIQLDMVTLNIVSLIEQVQIEYVDICKEKNLQVVMLAPSKEIMITLDSDKTYRIFENLFSNISKYAMENTRVYIDILEHDQLVEIQIKNISKDPMNFTEEEIVERFVRGDVARHESGSGLGLAIVKSFIEIQNGWFTIQVDGDLFKINLIFHKESE